MNPGLLKPLTATVALTLLTPATQAQEPAATELKAPSVKAAKKAKSTPKFGYKGGFFIASPDDAYKLKIGARVQTRFTFDKDDEGESHQFSIPRARLTLKGNVFSKDLTYKFQTDFGKGFVTLKDFYVDYRAIKGWLHIRAGQYKKPFSRQQLTSSSKLAMVDRALTDKAFGAGRDIGVMLHNKNAAFEYAVGLFNGTGDKSKFSGAADLVEGDVTGKFSNVPSKFNPMAVIRLGYNHGGIKGYSEADLKGGPFRFAIGASTKVDGGLDRDGDAGELGAELDFILKVSGFSLSGAAYYDTPLGEGDASFGFHTQLGYVIDGRYGLMTRYARMQDLGADGPSVQEIGGAFSLYAWGHKMKWQTDFSALIDSDPGAGTEELTYLVRTQVQLGF